jgi:hypothetical protein
MADQGEGIYLHLRRDHSIASRNTEQEAIIPGQIVLGNDWIVSLGRRIHLFQNIRRECLFHLKDIALDGRIGSKNALLDRFAHGRDMTVHGVVDNGNLGHVVSVWILVVLPICDSIERRTRTSHYAQNISRSMENLWIFMTSSNKAVTKEHGRIRSMSRTGYNLNVADRGQTLLVTVIDEIATSKHTYREETNTLA